MAVNSAENKEKCITSCCHGIECAFTTVCIWRHLLLLTSIRTQFRSMHFAIHARLYASVLGIIWEQKSRPHIQGTTEEAHSDDSNIPSVPALGHRSPAPVISPSIVLSITAYPMLPSHHTTNPFWPPRESPDYVLQGSPAHHSKPKP